MEDIIKKIQSYTMSRRSFIGMSACGLAAVSLPGCGLKKVATQQAEELTKKEGKWITAACWHNCGGRCLNKAYVMDGIVVRQKTDDTHTDTPNNPQQRGCARGRSQRHQVFGIDRIKYPMKRKNWEPGGGKKELRGRDEWVRISWDEALDIVSSEIKRVREKYGNNSIFVTGGSEMPRTLGLYGGHSTHWGTSSWGSWRWGPAKFGMQEGYFEHSINDRLDLKNSQLIVLWGGNPAWSAGGNPTYNYLQAKKAGAKFIIIDPIYTDTAETLEAQWIPIRPGTDHVMLLGMAYTLLQEDNPELNPLIDWDFIHRCTVGFDADHMPQGADPEDNLKDYILGTFDGLAKNPEWASEICGVDSQTIRDLALQIAKTKRAALFTAWAASRINNSDSWPQMFMAFGAMTGHMGQSGRMTGVSCHFGTGNGGPNLVKQGGNGLTAIKNPVTDSINDNEMWEAILNGNYTAGYHKQKDINIQLIYHGYNAVLQTRSATNKGIEAHRKVEFVVSHSHFLTTNSKYADIILPATTEWEREGGFGTGNREILIYYTRVTQPLFEAKHDQWMATEIGKRLGLKVEDIYPISEKQQVFNQLAGATVIKEDGSGMETLLTITAADIAEMGVQGKPQQGRITLTEFREKGIYQVERKPGDKYGYIGYEKFRQDPAANPLKTQSGKLEIHSKALAELIKGYGFTEIKPIPTYNKATEGYEDTFKDWNNKVKGDYPLQVINPHYFRRAHSIFDNIPQLREAFPNPVFVSTKDAGERGIKTGDTVLLRSRHGKTLRTAQITERLMPGVVGLPHGAWVDIDEKNGVDKAGADNILTGPIATGQGIGGWNTCNIQLGKWNGEALTPDVKWPQRIV
ncbi:Dimethyl sulfoxide reductase DmsA [Sporomusa silvacetica DSM 10669]|uniref:Dimethyl sulfoxide reductase DmsA n=1 Tax=Sporomusa silvacetica DSM 10669 TaxID=1123289 RepID=A0ABZ3II38_9FIRM|nr:molybdopterin-dependent oxidoreductase [Sporomusa silvacetica]OZC14894.1 dimethyl sulfoxide reductase DmsA precursor [Sporomusa silvacetica DSM 10669]